MRRRDLIKTVLITFLLSVVLCGTLFWAYLTYIRAGTASQGEVVVMDLPKTPVVVAKMFIDKGEVFTEENVQIIERYTAHLPDKAVTSMEALLNKRANAKIDTNVILTENMYLATDEYFSDDERFKDYSLPRGLVGDMVQEGDYIDIELVEQEGAMYVVLSKKQIIKKVGDVIYIHTDTEERKRMNYAMALDDLKGARLESSLYLDETQAPTPVTFVLPDQEEDTADTINNILEGEKNE